VINILPDKDKTVLFTGNYGSGKTEVAVNVVMALARAGRSVTIADLDIVNPYFRCREAREHMEKLGIRVIAPESDMHNADLPIVLPEVRGAIQNPQGITLLDVGGDNVGATVLGSLKNSFNRCDYEMYFVLNKNRPFTDTVSGALQLMNEIETASKITISGIIGNTHLMDETDIEMSRDGAEFCKEVAEARGLETAFVTAPMGKLKEAGIIEDYDILVDGLIEIDGFASPVLPLKRIMLPPWMGGPAPGSMVTHSRDGFARITKS
jgi:hypothetical protein